MANQINGPLRRGADVSRRGGASSKAFDKALSQWETSAPLDAFSHRIVRRVLDCCQKLPSSKPVHPHYSSRPIKSVARAGREVARRAATKQQFFG